MDHVADRFATRGVTSVFIYTREAHPGEHYPHHDSFERKLRHAEALRDHCGLRRSILVDDLAGTAHRGYGLLPNMTWIVGPGGIVLYKAAWTAVNDVEHALTGALEQLARRRSDRLRPVYTERVAWRRDDPEGFRAGLELAGPQALRDFYGERS